MKSKIIGFGILLVLFSCKTYTISVDSFRNQMTLEGNEKKYRKVEINNPLPYNYSNIKYFATNIKRIIVQDKNGNDVVLQNSPKLEMRITRTNGKKYVLLFDTVIVENDTLKGARSRILQNLTREIPMDGISVIEIQANGKVYKYQN